jgi:hypothetical protein
MRSRLAYLAVLLPLAVLGLARAADVHLAGSKLVVRQSADEERLVLVARADVLAPLPGGTEDPTLVGGEVEIGNPNTGERSRFVTSARDWQINSLGTIFRFRNHLETGPGSEVRTIVIKNRRQLKISARALGITLDEEAQRVLSVVVRTGTRRYCFLFGGKIGKDKPGRFVAHKAPAPATCPTPIAGATTTTTSRPPGTRPTSTTRPPATTTSTSTSATVLPTTSTSTSSSSSSTQPSVPTTSSTSVPSTSTTSTTEASCSFRGNSCKGRCPAGRRCGPLFEQLCICFLD